MSKYLSVKLKIVLLRLLGHNTTPLKFNFNLVFSYKIFTLTLGMIDYDRSIVDPVRSESSTGRTIILAILAAAAAFCRKWG